jgi:photosystem II stability/assembly factor-like uncharacterized protein
MKNIIVVLAGIVFFFQVNEMRAVNGEWKLVDSISFYSGNIFDFKCCDSLNCIYHVVLKGAGGHMFRRTTDGGITWKNVYLDSAYYSHDTVKAYQVPNIMDISYPNEQLFIATGDSGLILRTSDKGVTWLKYRDDKEMYHSTIRTFNEDIGIMSGVKYNDMSRSFHYATSDGGLTWFLTNRPPKIGIEYLQYVEKDLLVGKTFFRDKDSVLNSYIIYVNNNWYSWDTVRCPSSSTCLYFYNKDIGWVAGGHKWKDSAGWVSWVQFIHRTTDGGRTWIKQLDSIMNGYSIHDIEFYDENFGMASSSGALIYITVDGGNTWKDELLIDTPQDGSPKKINDIQVVNDHTAFVVYNLQYIFKYTRPTTSVMEKEKQELTISPNPATDYIEITGSSVILSEAKDPFFRIYDVLGVEVNCGISTPPAPSQEGGIIRIDVSLLSPGVYFVQVGVRLQKFVKY